MSIETRLGTKYFLSAADHQFIADMRRAAANDVGYGFMQQVIEWEWQEKHLIGAWGPEYFNAEAQKQAAEIERLTAENERLKKGCAAIDKAWHKLVEKAGMFWDEERQIDTRQHHDQSN